MLLICFHDDYWVTDSLINLYFLSTICLVSIDPETGLLQTANIGDSGVFVFRPKSTTVLYQSTPQQLFWNCPFQLECLPAGFRVTTRPHTASDAEVRELQVENGDVVLVASDGFYDNVWQQDIEKLLCKEDEHVGELALSATKLAASLSIQRLSLHLNLS